MATILHEIPEDPNEDEKSPTSVDVTVTPYERLLQTLHDPKFSHEIALEKRVGLYKFCGDIGRGNFSRVKKAIHLLTKDKVAIKIVDRSRLDTRNLRMLSREVSTLESVQHPYILRLFEVVETLGRVHLVTEFIEGGEMYYRIVQNGVFPEHAAVKIFKQVVLAVQHMHHLGFVHRDIKAENVLVITDEHVKLADFGFSTQIHSSQDFLNTFCGSPPYASPELFSDEKYLGSPVDIWSTGILLYFMLIGNMPFSAPTIPQLRNTILKGEYQLPGILSQSCIKLIQCILLHNPLHRPSADQILRSEWIQRTKKPPSAMDEAKTVIRKRKKASFWCTKSKNQTSPLSPNNNNKPQRQLEPIDCYTKKYNSISPDKFKNPLDDAFLSSAKTMIPINNHNLNRNNSLINSSKIVSKNYKSQAVEIVQNNDIIQVRSYSNDEPLSINNDDQSSIESERDFERFLMTPTCTNNDPNLIRALNPLERDVRKIMNTLGIKDDILEKNIEHGVKSEIIGIYRIIIMRLKTQKEQSLIVSQSSGKNQTTTTTANNSIKNHKSQRKKHNMMCAIL